MKTSVIVLLIIGLVIYLNIQQKSYVIERSSDSSWERSDKDYNDTVITRMVILRGDTLYPTIEYKKLK